MSKIYKRGMLNRVQQVMLRGEFDRIRLRSDLLDDAGPAIERIGAALDRILEDGGYLTFIGE
jgi:hypothetical protein